jgi:hypothetical protein
MYFHLLLTEENKKRKRKRKRKRKKGRRIIRTAKSEKLENMRMHGCHILRYNFRSSNINSRRPLFQN